MMSKTRKKLIQLETFYKDNYSNKDVDFDTFTEKAYKLIGLEKRSLIYYKYKLINKGCEFKNLLGLKSMIRKKELKKLINKKYPNIFLIKIDILINDEDVKKIYKNISIKTLMRDFKYLQNEKIHNNNRN
jgi:hypothetical protein